MINHFTNTVLILLLATSPILNLDSNKTKSVDAPVSREPGKIIQYGSEFNSCAPLKMSAVIPNNCYPTVTKSMVKVPGAVNVQMFDRSEVRNKPQTPTFTENACGGCVPVAAIEYDDKGGILWSYLVHTHGDYVPISVASNIVNPRNVYVVVSVFSGASTLDYTIFKMEDILADIDPNDVIPKQNTILLYGQQTKFAIMPNGEFAVDIK